MNVVNLTGPQILELDDLPREAVVVPEWKGTTVYVRGLDAKEREEYEQSGMSVNATAGGKLNVTTTKDYTRNARLVVKCSYDADGVRLFGDKDVDKLAGKNASAVEALSKVIRRLSGMTKEVAEALGKDSATTPADNGS